MREIQLDQSRLYGFKILPEISLPQADVAKEQASADKAGKNPAVKLGAKVGAKPGVKPVIKIGAKIGVKIGVKVGVKVV